MVFLIAFGGKHWLLWMTRRLSAYYRSAERDKDTQAEKMPTKPQQGLALMIKLSVTCHSRVKAEEKENFRNISGFTKPSFCQKLKNIIKIKCKWCKHNCPFSNFIWIYSNICHTYWSTKFRPQKYTKFTRTIPISLFKNGLFFVFRKFKRNKFLLIRAQFTFL